MKAFKDHRVQSVFDDLGFVVLPLEASVVEAIRTGFADLFSNEDGNAPFFASTDVSRPDFRELGDALIRMHLQESSLLQRFCQYRPYFSSFVVKQGEERGDSRVDVHADWSLFDESRAQALSLWIPLQDVDASNGCMHVLPGSHRWSGKDRGVRAPGFSRKKASSYAWSDLCPVAMRFGQVLCYQNGLWHGSPSNRTSEVRAAALLPMLPEGFSPTLYYRPRWWPWARIQAFRLEGDFFHHYDKWSRPTALHRMGSSRAQKAQSESLSGVRFPSINCVEDAAYFT